jgi:cell wall-associated NlpC family hydrolase
MAGRRLPVRRAALVAALAGAALCAGPAAALDTWAVGPGPDSAATWTVQAADSTQAPPADPTPADIVAHLSSASDPVPTVTATTDAAPAAPPAAVATDAGATVDPNDPAVRALAEAQAELDGIAGDLARSRTAQETATGDDLARLQDLERELTARKATVSARVDELTAKVAELQAEAERKAEKEAAAKLAVTGYQTNPFLNQPGGTRFAPVAAVSGDLSSQLDAFLAAKGSPLAGLGTVFVSQAQSVGLDPRLLVAISGAETSFGTYGPSQAIQNPFGLGPGLSYPTWADAIAAAARNLGGNLYKGSGLVTISQIQSRWAPLGTANDPANLNSNWTRNVSRYYAEQGGNPEGSVFTDTSGTIPVAIPVAPGVASGIQGTVAAPVAYGPGQAVAGGGSGTGAAALQSAMSYLGVPYLWGGTRPETGFDCSGLVQYVYALQGVQLPRVAEAQAAVGIPVSPQDLKPGDAIFFADRTGYIHHEGLYAGNGYFIHAPHTGDVVKISSLYEPYYATQYAGARRY